MLNFMFNRTFFRDRTMIVLGVILLLGILVNVLIVMLNLSERSFPIAVRYSDFSTSPLERDSWTTLYALPVFTILAGSFNLFSAVKVHEARRDIALGVMGAALLIMLINGFVSWSLLSVNDLAIS